MNKFHFDSVVGNFTTLQFLKRDIAVNASGKLLLFHGEVGTGKSSTALIYALAYCCENPTEEGMCMECETCRRNLLAVSKGQNSPTLSVINMGLYRKSTDAVELINQIFVLQTTGKTVYVLEEFHLLPKDVQANFLREIDNMSGEMKIILTTSSLHQISDAISSRSNKFMFSKLNKTEARRLVRLCQPSVMYSEEVMEILFEISDYTPRDILVNLEFLKKTGATEEEVRSYLQYVSTDDLLDLFETLVREDVSGQRTLLTELRSRVSLKSLEMSLRKFVLNALYSISGCREMAFTEEQVKRIGELFDKDFLLRVLNEMDRCSFDHQFAVDDLFFRLMFQRNRKSLAGVVSGVKTEAAANAVAQRRQENVLAQESENHFSRLTKQSIRGGV